MKYLLAILLLWGGLSMAQTKRIVILHTNDQHGHLLPFSYPKAPSGAKNQVRARHNVGGIARRATVVKQIRAKEKNVYLFDAGDCMDGTPFSVEYHDVADYETMGKVGYDYSVFGNHDFNLTPEEFEALHSHIHFPMMLANVVKKGSDSTILPPYIIKDWDGIRVAVMGLVTQDAQSYPAARKSFDVLSPLETAKKWVPVMRAQADLVMLVTHTGVALDSVMAREVPGIDLIVGGHSHTRLPEGLYQATDNPDAYDAKGTVIVQDGSYTPELGRLDIDVEPDGHGRWHVTKYKEHLLPLTSNTKDDPATARTLAQYWKPIKAKYSKVIGTAKSDFTDYPNQESSNYYLLADASQEATGSEFDIENQGGVRAPLLAGPVTVYDLVTMYPFSNTLITTDITGKDLRDVLKQNFPQPSHGLHYSMHHSGSGAKEKWVVSDITVNDRPIKDNTIYHISTNSYFAKVLAKSLTNVVDTKQMGSAALEQYISRHSPIAPSKGRIKVVEE